MTSAPGADPSAMCTQCPAIASDVAAPTATTGDDPAATTPRRRQHLLAVDVGRVRIGLATATPGEAAQPLEVLTRKGTRKDGAHIVAQLDRLGANAVVVGLPPQGDTPGQCSARLARRFAEALAAMQPRPVLLVDEAGTSVEAEQELRALGLRAARRKRAVDMVAAARILARYLAGEPAFGVAPQTTA